VIEKIRLPFDNGNLSNGDQIFWVAIRQTPTIEWRLKHFGRHPMVWVCRMAIEIF
jgi:hypothetical protein